MQSVEPFHSRLAQSVSLALVGLLNVTFKRGLLQVLFLQYARYTCLSCNRALHRRG